MTNAHDAPEPPLTVSEFARRTGLTRRHAYYLVESGKVPSLRFPGRPGIKGDGGVIRIEAAEVAKLLASAKQNAAAAS